MTMWRNWPAQTILYAERRQHATRGLDSIEQYYVQYTIVVLRIEPILRAQICRTEDNRIHKRLNVETLYHLSFVQTNATTIHIYSIGH